MFPVHRPRRLRQVAVWRDMVRETRLSPASFVFPMFVVPGRGVRQEIGSMPGNYHLSVDALVEECREVADLGIPALMLFGIPEKKDEEATGAWEENGIVQQATRALKRELPRLQVITDVCLCEYMSHGHCGVVSPSPSSGEADPSGRFEVLNDPTLEILARTAVSQVRAGADMVAPSDMMDGRVGAIRRALDAEAFTEAPIMSYAAKFASGFYGPFREAADSAPQFGDRCSYQMDPANRREALREMQLDLEEGADILMVKPALPYLDVLSEARDRFDVPLAAYQVSGEYAMILAAARMGWLDCQRVMMESLLSIRRAGADVILTYFAKVAARTFAK
jgi:porphobilinogen synthase